MTAIGNIITTQSQKLLTEEILEKHTNLFLLYVFSSMISSKASEVFGKTEGKGGVRCERPI